MGILKGKCTQVDKSRDLARIEFENGDIKELAIEEVNKGLLNKEFELENINISAAKNDIFAEELGYRLKTIPDDFDVIVEDNQTFVLFNIGNLIPKTNSTDITQGAMLFICQESEYDEYIAEFKGKHTYTESREYYDITYIDDSSIELCIVVKPHKNVTICIADKSFSEEEDDITANLISVILSGVKFVETNTANIDIYNDKYKCFYTKCNMDLHKKIEFVEITRELAHLGVTLKIIDSDCSNIKSMYLAFNNYEASFIELDRLRNLNIDSMECAFKNCEKLKEVRISYTGNQKMKNMSGAFQNCKNLKLADLSNIDIEDKPIIEDTFRGVKHALIKINAHMYNYYNHTYDDRIESRRIIEGSKFRGCAVGDKAINVKKVTDLEKIRTKAKLLGERIVDYRESTQWDYMSSKAIAIDYTDVILNLGQQEYTIYFE